jgi:NADP-dependent 3-hydroxy acid dehydrogenase YdfG
MSYLKMGHITPIRPINVFDASSIQDAFRYMQQGQHIGKIVISMRDIDGNLKIDTAIAKKAKKLTFDSSASYLLVGGLGGIGRAVSLYLVKHSVRRLVYLTPKAGRDDQDFIQELESMGCHVQLVLGSVTNKDDVNLAIQQAANLKGILQCSMILRDQIFTRMSLDEWSIVAAPKVQGTWNLHNAALSAGIQLDCFLLFSSISGLIGRAGQANYSGANSFLDAFVQYRTNLGLSAAALDIGAVRDVGYLSRDEALMKKMQMASGYGITEREILEAVGAAMSFSKADKTYRNTLESEFVSRNVIVLGLGTDTSLDSPENRIIWRKDRRMAVYHNLSKDTLGHPASNSSGGLQSFLSKARSDANILRADDTAAFLAKEIGKKLFGFLLKPDEDPSTSVPLSQLGMDSLVGVEMRSWWRQAFGFDISVLELLGMGNLEGLGEHAAQGLLKAMES